MKKIIILGRSINQGGIDLVGQELAKSLAKKYATYYCTFFLLEETDLGDGVKVLNMDIPPTKNIFSKVFNILLRFLRFQKLVAEIKPDLVVAQGNIPNIVVGLSKKLGSSFKSVLTVHNTLSKDLTGASGKMEKMFLKFISKNANIWVADSDYVAEDFKKYLGVSNTVTIPNPISPYSKDKREFNNKFIFTAGRLVPQKDFITLIKAFALVAKEITSLDLIIAGEGPLLEELKSLAKSLNIYEKVKLIGYEKNLYSYLNKCEVFVSSSAYEGMPMIVLQALDIGKAIVSTEVPGTMDAVGKSGLFSPVGDAEKLAQNIIKILRNKNLKEELETQALIRAKEFSSSEVGRKWVELLEVV